MKEIFLFILLAIPVFTEAQITSWPEITRENKPWTRWWWPGSIVTSADLTFAMEKYRKAGLGGMEIAVIYGVKGQEEKIIDYLSPRWMEMFTHTLAEAVRLDLGIDLANASGWPFGGPWVVPSDACKNINYNTYFLKEGDTLAGRVEFIQQPLVRPVGQRPDITKLNYPISHNDNLQLYALDQIRFEKPLPLKTLMAFSDKGQVVNLTKNVTGEKKLEWTAPEGSWTLYALFEGWHGKMAERAGPGGEGDVIDHFSGKAINNYLKHFDEIFKGYDLKSLRGYFNDSYEVDDASGQADWTDDLFNEFSLRRGYDLRYHLPALFQKDNHEINACVLSDYRQTISDLILEKFTSHWTEWAHRQGKITRNQSHGSPGNILDLYAASDIPETEGNEISRFKFASAAANVTGKRLISCEAATWLGEHFSSSLSDVKRAADLFFLAGINHLFYHGTCFSPVNEPWPGFQFYASVEFNPANSFWNDFEALNGYIARVQSFLQGGRPDNDILIYFPVFDLYAEAGKGMLRHFDALGPEYDGKPFKKGVDIMLEKGYAFDYISDLQINKTEAFQGMLQTEGNTYKTLILPGCKYIPPETFSQILKLANKGAYIIVYGNLPENVSGLADLESRTVALLKMKDELKFESTGINSIMKAATGKGTIIKGDDLNELLVFAGIRREAMADRHISFTRRKTPSGSTYFLVNNGENPFDGWLPLSIKGSTIAIFNPVTEESGVSLQERSDEGTSLIYARLMPGESLIISSSDKKEKEKRYVYYDPKTAPVNIKGIWRVDFTEGGPSLPSSTSISNLESWTLFEGDDVKNFSGTANYSITFNKPEANPDAWQLDLGRVCESARVILNGEELAVITGPVFSVIIDKKQLKSENALEVKVSNLMANRIAWLDRNNIEWKKFYNINFAARLKENTKNGIFDASAWQPRESGLIGPVTITPLKKR